MKTKLLLAMALGACFPVSGQQYSWQQQPSIPSSSRHAPCGFEINGAIYFGTGQDSVSTGYNDLWEYQPAGQQWTQKASLPGPTRLGANAFSLGVYGYVCCGWTSTVGAIALNDAWQYDPGNNSWTALDTLPGAGRYTASSFTIGNKGYVGGGFGAGGPGLQNDFFEFDPSTGNWTALANCPAALQSASGFSLNGKGYIVGGHTTSVISSVTEYDPLTNSWTPKNNFPQPVAGAFAFVIDGIPVVGSGIIQTSPSIVYSGNVYLYDSLADSWSATDTFPALSRSSCATVSTDIAAFVFGGNHQTGTINPLRELWKYEANPSGLPPAVDHLFRVHYDRGAQSIIVDRASTGTAQFVLFDLSGHEVYRFTLNSIHERLRLNSRNLGNGIFLYVITGPQRKSTQAGKLFLF